MPTMHLSRALARRLHTQRDERDVHNHTPISNEEASQANLKHAIIADVDALEGLQNLGIMTSGLLMS